MAETTVAEVEAGAAQAPKTIEQLLVEEGVLSEEQVARARRIQSRLEDFKPIASLVVDLGWVPHARVEATVRKHRRQLAVEEILIEKKLLDPEALRKTLAEHGIAPGPSLGRRLVEFGLVSEKDYLQTYCERFDIPFVEPDPTLLDPELLRKVSHKYLLRHRILPLSIQDGRLTILVDDLPDRQIVTELERLFSASITIALGPRKRIEEAIAAIPSGKSELSAGSSGGSIQYHNIQENVDADRITSLVDLLIVKAIRQGASDIHVEPMQSKLRVRFRIDGSLVHVTDYPQSYTAQIISRIKVLAEADVAEHRIHQDGKIFVRLGDEEIDLRASFYVTVFGENAVLRVLRKTKGILALDEMGFPTTTLHTLVEDVLEPATGIVLVTGPTGSGKTTTLYAAVDRINDPTKKIITCEDPVEYVIESITQCSIAQRPGINFVDSLRAVVRQDPDVVLIGEIRDRASAEIAIQSALTGHKVLSTFHTEDSVGALVRLVDMQIETFLIASTVTAVLAQRLLRRQCPRCKIEDAPSPREIRGLGLSRDELSAYPLTRGRGCPNCLHTGFRGRIGVYELLLMTDPLRDAIIARKPSHELRRLAAERPGFLCLQEDGVAKVLRGETTLGEVLENTPRSASMRPLARLMEAYD